LYWKLISKVRRPVGRRQTSKEVQELIFGMVVENPTWGAPRIHGELLMVPPSLYIQVYRSGFPAQRFVALEGEGIT